VPAWSGSDFVFFFCGGGGGGRGRKSPPLLIHTSGHHHCSEHREGRDSSIVIATRYGRLTVRGSNLVGREIFCTLQNGTGFHPASYSRGTWSFPGVKRPEPDVEHPPPPSAEVKGRGKLYLYSPSRPLWPVLGLTLPLPLPANSKTQARSGNSAYVNNTDTSSLYKYGQISQIAKKAATL
jgi:hypothetical protein